MGYLRIKIGLSAAAISVLGYTLAGGAPAQLPTVFLSAFLFIISIYSFNTHTDTVEDYANRRGINSYATSKSGVLVSAACAIAAACMAGALGMLPLLLLLGGGAIGFMYSVLGWKRILHLKNMSIAVGFLLDFLYGVFSGGPLSTAVAAVAIAVFAIIFGMSVLADMRDVHGDRLAGVRTYAALFGIGRARPVVALSFAVAGIMVIASNVPFLLWLVPFLAASTLVAYASSDSGLAHHYMRVGIILVSVIGLFR